MDDHPVALGVGGLSLDFHAAAGFHPLAKRLPTSEIRIPSHTLLKSYQEIRLFAEVCG